MKMSEILEKGNVVTDNGEQPARLRPAGDKSQAGPTV